MQIHYFQRYRSKENVDTSNTMLMLSRLYNYSTDKFFAMLSTFMLQEEESPELSFELQVGGVESIPDAVISQKSLKIVVETKLKNNFNQKQLMKHLAQFKTEEIKVLLTLDPKPMKQGFADALYSKLKQYNEENKEKLITPIKHVNITFEQLVTAMEDIIDERDTEIMAVLEDFKKYCFDEKLIPDGYKWMRAIVVRTTLADNMELDLYYDQTSRGFSDHGYIGLYSNKSIRGIGKVVKIVIAEEKNGELECRVEKGDEITRDEMDRIKEAISRSEKYGYNLKTVSHRYFIVDKFYSTNFRKITKNPIQRSKYFNLEEMLGDIVISSTEQIAQELDGKTWEELT